MAFFEALLNQYWGLDPRKASLYQATALNIISGDRRAMPEDERQGDREAVYYLDNSNRVINARELESNSEEVVAVVDMIGVVFKRADAFSEMSGVVSMSRVGEEVAKAANNPSVKAIVLNIDSPGGTVKGTADLSRIVREAREVKPVIAIVNELCASAAYWVAAQATEIHAVNNTAEIGSIGVLLKHLNFEGFYKKEGVEISFLTSDKATKKVTAPDTRAITEDEKTEIVNELNYLHGLFETAVLEGRGAKLSADSPVFNGAVFMAQEALSLGLIDEISTFNEATERARNFSIINNSLFSMETTEKQGLADKIGQVVKSALGLGDNAEKVATTNATAEELQALETSVMSKVEAKVAEAETQNAELVAKIDELEGANAELEAKVAEQAVSDNDKGERLAELATANAELEKENATLKGAGPGNNSPGDNEPGLGNLSAEDDNGEANFLAGIKQKSGIPTPD